jgi:hypothetical protein
MSIWRQWSPTSSLFCPLIRMFNNLETYNFMTETGNSYGTALAPIKTVQSYRFIIVSMILKQLASVNPLVILWLKFQILHRMQEFQIQIDWNFTRTLWCTDAHDVENVRSLLVSYNAVFCCSIFSQNNRLTMLQFFFKSARICWNSVQLFFEQRRAVYVLHYRRGDWWWGRADMCPSCKGNIIHLHINDMNGKLG